MKFLRELERECECGNIAHSAKEFYANVVGFDLDIYNKQKIALSVTFYCCECGGYKSDYVLSDEEFEEILYD